MYMGDRTKMCLILVTCAKQSTNNSRNAGTFVLLGLWNGPEMNRFGSEERQGVRLNAVHGADLLTVAFPECLKFFILYTCMTKCSLLFSGYPMITDTVYTDTEFSRVPSSLQQSLQQI